MKTIKVHICTIKAGDTVLHNEKEKTVGTNDLKHSSFMGKTLFGDSYQLGYKQVTKVLI